MTTKQEKNSQDFKKLANLANQARALRDVAILDNPELIEKPLNFFIQKIYKLENQKLKTFTGWKKEGYKVKKGEKGYLFFSTPKAMKKEVENKQGEKQTMSFNRFCKCFLFSQDQVERIAGKETTQNLQDKQTIMTYQKAIFG